MRDFVELGQVAEQLPYALYDGVYVHPEYTVHDCVKDGLVPHEALATVMPSLRLQIDVLDCVPVPQDFEHDPHALVFQLYVHPEVLVQD